ncbi:RRQRL motif-containing zinc-binding protein [Pseudonocardia sp. DSM 110487]|uniref:RRQRL motif-containing zinc-binding protein n=1 Tax=Pseudonocardia sp. DSM 110487 TaxID=2865833 RepID=UPI0021082CF8|nr:RRQRL motif-containing zinc-binding protein [Pseudonocardia sp. DSM 110487]
MTEALGVMTERWGWQPTARLIAGLPAWSWRSAPKGLVTRRQMRVLDLAPGGAEPVGLVVCRRGRRWAHLWDRRELVPKRRASPAQLEALERAMAARRWCRTCKRDVGYCVPRSLGECVECAFPASEGVECEPLEEAS